MKTCQICGGYLVDGECPCGGKKKRSTGFSGIPHWPEKCMVTGCDEDTDIVFVVGTKDGNKFQSNGGTFLFHSKEKGYIEKEGCKFEFWVTRCADHYVREVEHSWCEGSVKQFQEEHPEFKFVPKSREDVKDLIAMTRKFALRSFLKLPYEKTKAQAEPEYNESELLAGRKVV